MKGEAYNTASISFTALHIYASAVERFFVDVFYDAAKLLISILYGTLVVGHFITLI